MLFVEKGDGAGFHGNSSILLVKTIVEQLELSCLLAVDESIGGDETICEGGFAVVDVGDDRDVPDVFGLLHQAVDHFIASLLSKHCSKILL